MKLEIFGNDKDGYSGHGQSDESTELRACPFCGSENVEIVNTHTPYYWGQCIDCECEGPKSRSPDRHARSKRGVKNQHEEAFKKAVINWNSREQV